MIPNHYLMRDNLDQNTRLPLPPDLLNEFEKTFETIMDMKWHQEIYLAEKLMLFK